MNELEFCIEYLKKYNHIQGMGYFSKKDTLRALMNITMPIDLSNEYYQKQDIVLSDILSQKGITDVESLPFLKEGISLFQGDITTLKADAIVNACNEKLLGCFSPLHSCIDNAIHSAAGLQVRRDLYLVMVKQGHDEENGQCKVTSGYNLKSRYIFHTVGPKAFGKVTEENEQDLRNCYLSCLKKATEMNLNSLVFCSLSTGVYGYPIEEASLIATQTVYQYLKEEKTSLKRVVFNVFSERDKNVYYRRIEELA